MKKTIKLVAVVMVIAMLALSLVACGKSISGKYSAEANWGLGQTTYTYDFTMGGKVTRTTTTDTLFGNPETKTAEGKYEIMEDNENPDKYVIAFEFPEEDRVTYSYSEGTIDGEKVIIINGTTFTKVK